MSETPVRFGVLGCATIARILSRAIKLAPNASISAIGSRSIDKASKFASDNGFPASAKVYGSYEAVLDDPEVDAVYVPLPTSLHLKWAALAAEKKKHLLLEKPVALDVKELDTILEACESNGVQFMDATMWMHHPRTAKKKEFLSDPRRFGQLKLIHSIFTFDAGPDFLNNNIRVKPDLDALGALGDAGWYCIRAILWAADYELPKSTTALPEKTELNQAGVILSCGASLNWADGKVATFHCSFLTKLAMELTATGTEGNLHVDDFVRPLIGESEAKFYAASDEHTVTTDLPQEALMVTELACLVKGIRGNGLKPEKKWPTMSRKTQLVVDAVKASIERGFEAVEVGN
ncbi:uncharacterized oxidoreductase At4g09670-like [Camellia sinensis]|uniref:uncharacterized oxidoreductase At4g09670-like n=1 Tax=Camellia sinensis TaxID=4442 RepID=UPI001036EC23|nr:uncharacterized oxidoreductase At4g09670-like [Camellia sinensis]